MKIGVDGMSLPLAMPADGVMRFGDETISARDYAYRVIERGDDIDAVLLPRDDSYVPMEIYWIRIEYRGSPPPDREFSKKDDGLFAMRTKAGEKAERRVAIHLRDQCGHVFPDDVCRSQGFFEIRYTGKGQRRPGKPDLTCRSCGLKVEVKRRNKDSNLRVSHSAQRPFSAENADDGWHAFVFPDTSVRFVRNGDICRALAANRFRPGRDRYDAWADINDDAIFIGSPPACRTNTDL